MKVVDFDEIFSSCHVLIIFLYNNKVFKLFLRFTYICGDTEPVLLDRPLHQILTESVRLVVVCQDASLHVYSHVTAAAVVVQTHGPHHGGHRSADHHLRAQNRAVPLPIQTKLDAFGTQKLINVE